RQRPYRAGCKIEEVATHTQFHIYADQKIGNDEFVKDLCLSIKVFQVEKVKEVVEQIRAARNGDGIFYYMRHTKEYGTGNGSCQVTEWKDNSFQIRLFYADSIDSLHPEFTRGVALHPLRSYLLKGVIECLTSSEHQWRCLFRDDNSSSSITEKPLAPYKCEPYDSTWKNGVLSTIEQKVSAYY
ncbi:MAG: hypothetical protein HQK53_07260, partial [Oligoflexia bacterium]|nr:hypothetical protein [Oligoflexia bacterium]